MIITNAFAQGDENWKTFISPEYKFSIDYPADLEAHYYLSSSKLPNVYFYSNDYSPPSSLILNIFPKNMSLQGCIDHTVVGQKLIEGPTPITIAEGNPGQAFSFIGFVNSINKEVLFTHGDHIYNLIICIIHDKNFNESQYDHI